MRARSEQESREMHAYKDEAKSEESNRMTHKKHADSSKKNEQTPYTNWNRNSELEKYK